MGREFDNTSFHTFCNNHGMQFRFSCPNTSSQNGKSERMIRTLNDITRSLLTHASIPPSYWVDAIRMATYLHNILPTKALGFDTPTHVLYGRIPTYDHLRVFGCLCFPNLSATMKHKLSPRSTPCIFLGYPDNHRGYACLDISSKQIILSRHVTFDETVFPFTNIEPYKSSSYDFLDSPPISPLVLEHLMASSPSTSTPPPSPLAASPFQTDHTTPYPLVYTRRRSSLAAQNHPDSLDTPLPLP